MDEQMQQQIVQLVQAAMQGDQQAQQQVQQIMEAAQQGDPQAQQIAQLIQQIVQQMQGQQAQMARLGAKLNYIKYLNGKCPAGYEMTYYKQGGKTVKAGCKKCKQMQKNEPGGNIDPVAEFKCGRKMKKKAECGSKIRKNQNPAEGALDLPKYKSRIQKFSKNPIDASGLFHTFVRPYLNSDSDYLPNNPYFNSRYHLNEYNKLKKYTNIPVEAFGAITKYGSPGPLYDEYRNKKRAESNLNNTDE